MVEALLPPLIAGLALFAIFVWLMHELRKRPSLLQQIELERRDSGWLGRRLGRVARFRLPVYSAETAQGKEAEFIRDRLPTKFPTLLVVGVVTLGVLLAIWKAIELLPR
jgi:hypothetical protein